MILRAAWVLPITAPPICDGVVRFDGERIVAVGRTADVASDGESVTDLGDALLMPGLVNAHTHLELTCYAGQLGPSPFWSWLPGLVKLRAAPGQIEREQQGVHDGAWQSLRAGVTCVGDISRRNLNWSILKPIPIRKVCYVELLSLADEPPRNLAELRAGVAEVQEDPLLTVGVTPHAPYSVPGDQMRGALALATELRRPWCTHWAETAEERRFLEGDAGALPWFVQMLLVQCRVRSPRLAAMAYLEQCSAGSHAGVLAHFNYAAPGDAERLAQAGHAVVYCPRAHRFFGHSPHPYRDFLAAGVLVAIGTDSAASNENLALLEELRFLRRETANPPPAETLLRMVTLGAARALGLGDRIGSLEPDKLADLAAFPCPHRTNDPLGVLLDQAPRPLGVWVGGERVSP